MKVDKQIGRRGVRTKTANILKNIDNILCFLEIPSQNLISETRGISHRLVHHTTLLHSVYAVKGECACKD